MSVFDIDVKSIMSKALIKQSKKFDVDLKDFRIKLSLDSDFETSTCFAMNKSNVLQELSWHNVLGGGVTGFTMGAMASETVKVKLIELAKSNNIDNDKINVRIFAVDSKGTPKLHLFSDKTPLKQMELSELI